MLPGQHCRKYIGEIQIENPKIYCKRREKSRVGDKFKAKMCVTSDILEWGQNSRLILENSPKTDKYVGEVLHERKESKDDPVHHPLNLQRRRKTINVRIRKMVILNWIGNYIRLATCFKKICINAKIVRSYADFRFFLPGQFIKKKNDRMKF